jgi:RNA polymerase sigma factor (sigma-70 family)
MEQPTADNLVADLAGRYGEELVRFLARRLRTAADAPDLAQEAYVRLLRLNRTDLIRDPQAYLYRIAVNLLREFNLNLCSDREGLRQWIDERTHERDSLPADSAAQSLEIRARLDRILSELPPKSRAAVILHRRDGMTYDEIAQRLKMSPNTVKKHLSAGLRHCRARLGDLE